jgi:hypothetical protein
MSPAELAAYIGAAAWLPQIAQWIAKLVTKPKLKLMLAPTVSLGYTNEGPWINLTVALSAERQDALITNITVRVIHERGEERLLTWRVIRETYFDIQSPTGESIRFDKRQPALALKVSIEILVEKVIAFLDDTFKAQSQDVLARLLEHGQYLKEQVDKTGEGLVKSKEFVQAQDFFKNNLFWKEGKYTFEIDIFELKRRSPYRERFTLLLTKPDVERLKVNLNSIEPYLRKATLDDESQYVWSHCITVIRPEQ